MELDERTKERINNYFNSVSSDQLFKLAVKYNIREAIEWGQTKGKTLPIDSVSKPFYCETKRGCLEQCDDCALTELAKDMAC